MGQHLGSAEAWTAWYGFLARVEPAESSDGQVTQDIVRLTVERNYNLVAPKQFILPAWVLSRSPDPRDRWDVRQTKPGIHVVVWMPQKVPGRPGSGQSPEAFYVVADTTQTAGPDAGFIQSLELIAAYRNAVGESGAKAAMAIFTSQADLPLQYLCGALATGKKDLSAEEEKQLLAVRDNERLAALTRVLASEALQFHDPAYANDRAHYTWLLHWFMEPHTLDTRPCCEPTDRCCDRWSPYTPHRCTGRRRRQRLCVHGQRRR